MVPYPDMVINQGSFVPTTYIWDVQQLYSTDVNTPEFKELLVRLYQYINNIATVLNTKDSAFYLLEQFQNSQLWFNPNSSNPNDLRACFRNVFNIGALGAGLTTQLHNLPIDASWKLTKIQGVASNTATLTYLPLPFAGAAGNNIELSVNGTTIIINNNSGVIFTDAYVVLEFVKN